MKGWSSSNVSDTCTDWFCWKRGLPHKIYRTYKLLQVEIIVLSFEEKLRNLFYIFWGENVLVLILECSLSGSATMYHTTWSSTWPELAVGMRSLSEVTTSSTWKWSRCSRLRSGYTSGSTNSRFLQLVAKRALHQLRRLMKPHCSRMSCPWTMNQLSQTEKWSRPLRRTGCGPDVDQFSSCWSGGTEIRTSTICASLLHFTAKVVDKGFWS